MAGTQQLPDWMEYTTYIAEDGVETTATVQLPLTYTGPSIPLDWPWVAADAPESERRRVSILGGTGYQYRTPGIQGQVAQTNADVRDPAPTGVIMQDSNTIAGEGNEEEDTTVPTFQATMEQALDPDADPADETQQDEQPFSSIVTLPDGRVVSVESPAIAFTSTATDGAVIIDRPTVSYGPDGSATLLGNPAVVTTLPNGRTSLVRPQSVSTTTLQNGSISRITLPTSTSSEDSMASPSSSSSAPSSSTLLSSGASASSSGPEIAAEQSQDDLSAGQIAGISLGSILFAGLLLGTFLIWFCVRRRQRLRGDDASWVGISNTPDQTPQMAQVGRMMPYYDHHTIEEPLTATTGTSRTSEAEQFADPHEDTRESEDEEPPPSAGGTGGHNGSGSNRSGFSRNTETTIDEDALFYSLPGTRVPSRDHALLRAPHLSDTREESESLLDSPSNPYRDSRQSEDLMGLNSPEYNDQEHLFTLPRPAPDVPLVSPPSDEPEEHDVVPDSRGIPLVSAASRVVGGYLGGLGIGSLMLGRRDISGESQVARKGERDSSESNNRESYTRPSTARLLGAKAHRRLTGGAVGLDDSPTLGQEDDSSAESEAESEEAAFLPYEKEKLERARWSKTTLGRKVTSEDAHEAHSLVASLRSASHNSTKHVDRSQNSSYGSNNTRRSVSESGLPEGRRSISNSRNGSSYKTARERSDSSGGHASRHTNTSDLSSSEQAEIWQLPAYSK